MIRAWKSTLGADLAFIPRFTPTATAESNNRHLLEVMRHHSNRTVAFDASLPWWDPNPRRLHPAVVKAKLPTMKLAMAGLYMTRYFSQVRSRVGVWPNSVPQKKTASVIEGMHFANSLHC